MNLAVEKISTGMMPDKKAEERAAHDELADVHPGKRNAPPVDRPNWNVQTIELAVFLLLIVPAMASSFMIGDPSGIDFRIQALFSILNDFGQVSLVFYFIWRNHEPLHRIGLNWRTPSKETLWGLVLFLPVMLSANGLLNVLHALGLSAPTTLPGFLVIRGKDNLALAVVLVTVVAIVEETIFRGYLILRLKTVTRRSWLAIVLSAAVFSIGHGYEGLAGVVSVFFLGVVLALVYLWRRSLIAPMIIHFFIDFSSIVLTALWKPHP
ncbi:MAG: type II CAAX endopeptidase family protein [Desulfosarcinaceae bacterium]|jgi:membrane protease YdiL (CAAX protease family)